MNTADSEGFFLIDLLLLPGGLNVQSSLIVTAFGFICLLRTLAVICTGL
jgi:hypothetical protein